MIYAFAGSPGSFKSVHVLEKYVIPALKNGRQVYTNIENISSIYIATYFDLNPIDVDNCLHVLGREYNEDGTYQENPDLIRKFYENVPNNALIVIDEAQNYFGSRDFKSDYSAAVIPYMTRHRHYGHDIIYITQNIDSVDITFRRNTQITYLLKRAEHVGMKNLCFVYVFDRANLDKRYLARLTYTPNPSVFKCYSSYEGDDVVESRKAYNVILRSKGFWVFLIGVLILVFMIVSGKFDPLFGKKKTPVQQKLEVSSSSVQPVQNTQKELGIYDEKCVKSSYIIHGLTKNILNDGSVVVGGDFKPCTEH